MLREVEDPRRCAAATKRTGNRCIRTGYIRHEGKWICGRHWTHGYVPFNPDTRDPMVVERMKAVEEAFPIPNGGSHGNCPRK